MDTCHLPELPEESDADDAVILVLFLEQSGNQKLRLVSPEDAKEYCTRDDTHGDGWFVGWFTQ